MTKKSIAEIVGTIVSELTPLVSEERLRAIQASLTLLGEVPIKNSPKTTSESESSGDDGAELPGRARTWLKQNGLSVEQLQQVFHVSLEGAEIIVSEIPGKINRDKVRNAYVLLGIAGLLSSGDAKFDDKAARALCERYGFYDHTNHTKYMKGGNEFTGSKDRGWTLTAPGLKHGAALLSELSKVS